jgi:hypothetical protein
MAGAVAIANPAPVKRKAMAKTPTARLRKERFGGFGETAAIGKSAFDLGSFSSTHLRNLGAKGQFENSCCG